MTSSTGSRRTPGDEPPGDGGAEEAVLYIRGVSTDLAQMARRHRHDMLGYLLDMAHMEAEEILSRRDRRKSCGR